MFANSLYAQFVSFDVLELDTIHVRLHSCKCIISLGKVLVDKKIKRLLTKKINAKRLTHNGILIKNKNSPKTYVNCSNKCVHKYKKRLL